MKQSHDANEAAIKSVNTDTIKAGNTKSKRSMLIGLFVGIVLGVIIMLNAPLFLSSQTNITAETNTVEKEEKPLYWVAPKDPNFRRDKPGQSPMGMDLVPYYGSQKSSVDAGQGTIEVSPSVINTLGVRTTTVKYSPLQSAIQTTGYVTYDEEQLIHLHSRVEGWIEAMHISAIGDTVVKGQALYDIYSPELINAQEEFLLALDSHIPRLITSAENRLIALKISKKTINQIKSTKKAIQNITFYAPQSGVVDSLAIRKGIYVKPEMIMLSIVDLSNIWVKAEVFERDISEITIGDHVSMQVSSLPSKNWYGKVEHIHPTLNPTTRTGVARLHFANQEHDLMPNMLATIMISPKNPKSVLHVPKEAVIRTGHQNRVVLALGDGYFKSIAVDVGRADFKNIEITSGLSMGDKVVSSAQFLLDSESSKTSDFKRMHHETMQGEHE